MRKANYKFYDIKMLQILTILILVSVFFTNFSIGQVKYDLNLTGECKKWYVPGAGDNPIKYFDSAEASCKDYIVRFRPGETWVKGNYVNGNNQYTCNSDFSPTVSITNALRATRDDCCEETIVGPYSDIIMDLFKVRGYYSFKPPKYTLVSIPPLRGMPYNGTQREQVILDNIATHGSLTSDVTAYMIPGVSDYCPNGLDASDPNAHCAPQVHHIMPRKDSKGCDCGRNSNFNALVISRKLNNEISNDCNSPKLKAILDFFKLSSMNLNDSDSLAFKVNMKPKTRVKSITPAIRMKVKKYVERMKE